MSEAAIIPEGSGVGGAASNSPVLSSLTSATVTRRFCHQLTAGFGQRDRFDLTMSVLASDVKFAALLLI